MPKNREQLKQEYIRSLDSFIAKNPKIGQLDTARFRDFLIGLVEHESGFNPTARQGSYFGWYQTNKLDSDPYQQHMNAFNHLNGLFRDTITKADVQKARSIGIKDASLMLKYWNQGNRVNNYIWNGKDSADGLGTKISKYGNDLTMPLDIYSYAMDNLTGNYVVKSGDNWFNLQKRVRIPGRDYATGGKDLWNMQKLAGRPYGSLRVGQKFSFGKEDTEYDTNTAIKVLPKKLISAWRRNPEKNHLSSGYTDDKGNWRALKSVYHPSWGLEMKEQANPYKLSDMLNYGYQEDYVSKYPVYMPFKHQQGGLIYRSFISQENDTPIKSNLFLDEYDNAAISFPVEPVQVYKPKELESEQNITQPQIQSQSGAVEYADPVPTSNPISTQTFHEETTPSVVRGTVEFKHSGIDVGNMQELIDLMQDEGMSFRITSGSRPGAKTSSGRLSHHGSGNALDITPIKGQTWDDLLNQMRKSKRFIDYMNSHGLGILDERGEAMQKKTGATGAHFHIGPDQIARTQFKYLVERWKTT